MPAMHCYQHITRQHAQQAVAGSQCLPAYADLSMRIH